jgi:AbrB family looped-hinge helix DNA binding protein
MLARLSTKGQLVIPKPIREALGLRPGTRFDIRLTEEGKLILDPILDSPIDALHGKYADADFLNALETEHRQEIAREETGRP